MPNPAKDVLHVEFETANNTDLMFYLTDVSGKKVKILRGVIPQQGINKMDIKVDDLPQGFYTLTITDGQKYTTEKVVISN